MQLSEWVSVGLASFGVADVDLWSLCVAQLVQVC